MEKHSRGVFSMKSTPAVYLTPAISSESASCLSSPLLLESESYPWAVKTPEDSPIGWDVLPNMYSLEPVLSREQLRAACEPYFEQMLIVIEQSVQSKVRVDSELAKVAEAMANAAGSSFQSSFLSMSFPSQYDRMLDEVSTEAGGSGAFSCLLSTPSTSRRESIDALDVKSVELFSSSQDMEPGSDSEKSNMVCRHWKSKGWCRMESNCKFLHPEHKRGIVSTRDGKRNSTNGDMSGLACPSISTDILNAEGELYSKHHSRRNRRGGRNRASRGYQGQLDNAEHAVGLAFNVPCSLVQTCF